MVREERLVAWPPVATIEARQSVTEYFVIEGGRPLSGTIAPEGNKNAALPIIAAALLTDRAVRLSNVPRIRDVEVMCELVADLGASVEWTAQNDLEIRAEFVSKTTLDRTLCSRIRASILLAGPLLARCGRVTVPPPGGDVIGRRRIDTHILAFEALGAEVVIDRSIDITASSGLKGAEVFLDEPSVTGTENAVMAAVLAPGRTCLINAACEPHVQDLCRMLVKMGARIEGIGSNMLHIDGVERLSRLRPPRRRRLHRDRVVRRPGGRHRRRRHRLRRRAHRPARHPARASGASASRPRPSAATCTSRRARSS